MDLIYLSKKNLIYILHMKKYIISKYSPTVKYIE